jgi:hypothetical protein
MSSFLCSHSSRAQTTWKIDGTWWHNTQVRHRSVPVMFESLGRENPKLISIMPSSSFQGGTVSNSTSNSTYLYFIMEPTLLGSSPPNSQYFSGSASVSDLHGLRLGSTLGIHDVSVPAVKVLGELRMWCLILFHRWLKFQHMEVFWHMTCWFRLYLCGKRFCRTAQEIDSIWVIFCRL